MLFEILTLFPSMFEGVFSDSILKRAVEKKLISIHIDNIRDYTDDPHRHVDDYPYGGDPGMLMKLQPVVKAISAAQQRLGNYTPKVIYLSPHGEPFTHAMAKQLRQQQALILLCGRYKGIDHRIRQKYIDYEISIGDYIISGGEIAAMVIVDAVSRLIPGVLGNNESASRDSFYNGLLSPPNYTRPEEFEGMRVPEILLSGHHENIRLWQQQQAEEVTRRLRPELWERYCGGKEEKK